MESSEIEGVVTTEVRETHRFDVAALERYMREHVEGFRGPVTVRQFHGGQSCPTYYLESPGGKYVLRRKPPGKLLPSAHAVDREYRVITALGGTDVPVPRTYALCEEPDVVGTAFYIMEYVHGRLMVEPDLPGVAPAERAALFDAMNDVLARLHTVDLGAVGLTDYGRPGNYFARQIHRWTQQYRASETEKIEAMEQLMEWLPAHVPADDQTTIVHGDYRSGNMLMHPTEPRVVAVLDWELSTLGHPLGDLGYLCTAFRMPPGIDGFRDFDLGGMGIPMEADVVRRYCRLTGRDGIPDWEFYVAFALFRLAAICQGIMGRVRDGTASDPDARRRGERGVRQDVRAPGGVHCGHDAAHFSRHVALSGRRPATAPSS
jgi:aminoglycoside phosphotransferase (APT) family kinase protein